MIKKLTEKGIPTAVHYPVPLHLQPGYQYLGGKNGQYPVSEAVANEIMSLPMHPFLTDEDINTVVKAVKEAL